MTNSKEACSIIASTSFVSFAKGTRSLVTEAPIIFFEEEEVNEYWILAFFLSNHVSIRKNKYESRKIRCYPLLFPAFPSRPALCFSSRILSSSFVLIPLRESFFISTCVVRLFASRREKQLEREIFTISSFRYAARILDQQLFNQRVSKSRKATRRKRRKTMFDEYIFDGSREREREV